jgi:hypothetical protein
METNLLIDLTAKQRLLESHLAWMNGFEEYLDWMDHKSKDEFKDIKRCVMQGNPYRLRNRIMGEMKRGWEEEPGLSYLYANVITSFYQDDLVRHKDVARYMQNCVEGEWIWAISQWINKHEDVDLNDHFSRGQMRSKMWMVDELRKIVDGNIGEVILYGGWFSTISWFFLKHMNATRVVSVDIDPATVPIAQDFNDTYNHEDKSVFTAVAADVNSIVYDHTRNTTVNNVTICPNIVVNTSCEHMNDEWFDNLPVGQFVVLQTNNYFENPQHVNCVESVEAAKEKYKFETLFYAGELDTYLYKRYMLIGIK